MPGVVRHTTAITAGGDPVRATLHALGQVNSSLDVGVAVAAVDRTGPEWHSIGDPGPLRSWYEAELRGPAQGHGDVAGALVAYRLAGALAQLAVGPLVLQHRSLVPIPGEVFYQLSAGPSVSALAVASPALIVLSGDPEADHPSTTVAAGLADLVDASAAALTSVFEPVTHVVRAFAPYGLRGMWGNLADHLAEAALGCANSSLGCCHGEDASPEGHDRRNGTGERDPGAGEEAPWDLAEALIDRLAARQPLLRGRPRLYRVGGADGSPIRRVVLKGTCCLVYKAYGRGPDGAPLTGRARIEAAACDTCPLRTPEDHANRLAHPYPSN